MDAEWQEGSKNVHLSIISTYENCEINVKNAG